MNFSPNSPSRRQIIFSATALVTAADMFAGQERISHTAESIHQENVIPASRKRVYEALTDARQFGEVTKLSADGMSLGSKGTEISAQVGGAFTLFAGHIIGRQLELLPGERIVQAWRVVDWKPGVYSIAKFELMAEGKGTRIVFDHTGFPEGLAQHLASGWTEHYWTPLAKYLA